MTMLKVENLSKSFGLLQAVQGLSFELSAGQVCGFVGPNGAGKTTTMRIISTLEESTGGSIFVEGQSISDDPYTVRRRIGFMPDHYESYPGLTVEDYLEFYGRAYELKQPLRSRRIESIMEFTGLDRIAHKRVETLSKGMCQRLSLGRVLINDPSLLILDEPAAGLDPRARVELRFLIRELANQNKTVFVSSHILSELGEMCDSVLIIDHGRKMAFGRIDEIRKSLQDRVEIIIRLHRSDQVQDLERFLLERESVTDVAIREAGQIGFKYLDEMARATDLLRDILLANFSVIEFRPQAMSMEDLFLQITEGEMA